MGPDVPLVLAAILEEVGVAVGTLLSPLHHHCSALQQGRVCPARPYKHTHSEHRKLVDIQTLPSFDMETEVEGEH